ncbi:hypothetical protein SH1V18_38600 [Vallitalea longa]|uniref:Uncharacterized protein n=1 Tax=Vallitalea longa TaxID=2936439 RepID=A0A9W6DG91_9FIRM|nr:hypothetical protein [Vallitalea longa]GKX31380.1 hypothetical protein SH1V18_38600 [Vallitalea longa]
MNKLIEDTHYYNNSYEIINDMVSIDRVYCLDLNNFRDNNWDTLGEIYKSLPSYIIHQGLPYWFGIDENNIYLWASCEPSGLQIAGYLPLKDFFSWENIFNKAILNLPFIY